MRDTTIDDMKFATIELINQGNNDPSTYDIVARYLGEKSASFEGIVDMFRPMLPRVMRELRGDGYVVFPMAQVFFDRGRVLPSTVDDVGGVTAIGSGKSTAGIHFVADPATDPIWMWWSRQKAKQHISGLQGVADDVALQVESGNVTIDEALELLTAGSRSHGRIQLVLGPIEDEPLQIGAPS